MYQSHSKKKTDILESINTNPASGLTSEEAAVRLSKYGSNKLVEETEIKFLSILWEEVREPMILLLLTIGVLYGIVNQGNLTDSLTILAVVTVLVLVEVWNEFRAKKSISALKKIAAPTTVVLRNGQVTEIESAKVVPGDILVLKPGERIPADSRLLESIGLEVDESALTGESFPVEKDTDFVLKDESRITEKKNMVFAGTVVTKGHGKAVVTETGVNTELGKVAGLTKSGKEPKTPLQVAMKELSKTLISIALFFSILIPVLSYLKGLPPAQAVLYGLSLSFATIPEEMPIIITMVLGVGAYTLSRKKAIIKHLRAAETLGNTTVIATDKTGTITENKMQVESLYFDNKIFQKQDFGKNEIEALKTAFIATAPFSNLTEQTTLNNPMSQAIFENLRQNGINIEDLKNTWILLDEKSFDNKKKTATYIYKFEKSVIELFSGAPENILDNSTKLLLQGKETELTEKLREQISKAFSEMAQKGLRLIGFGYSRIKTNEKIEMQKEGQEPVFVGVIGFLDPPRKGVREAIQLCQKAKIKVIMVTGDHPETAKNIAKQVGINSAKVITGIDIEKISDTELTSVLGNTFVFARTTPEDKLRIVRLLRQSGEIVAVTGDGINDAPALKEAHIGISMGIRGTDVAKETADMVLADDNFSTLTTAVKEGRKIFLNLRKGVRYYLACKVALVTTFLIPLALGIPLPFAPIQIIVLELFMDLAASATFVAEPEELGIMQRPPLSSKKKFMDRSMLTTIMLGALSLFGAVSINYLYAWYVTQNLVLAQTMAFATWMIGHIFLALNFRSENEPLLKLGLFSNKLMVLWALVVAATLIVATSFQSLHVSLKIESLSLANWAAVILVSFVATFWMELKKLIAH
jgi:Ca2+-transporting ATPase